MKKVTHTKTEFIQFRVDSELKMLAKETAHEYFNGNMSDMFRYALHNCDFEDGSNASPSKNVLAQGRNFTSLSVKDIDWLATIHSDYENQNVALNRIGNNLNQISHKTNAQAKSKQSPVTRDTLEQLKVIGSDIKSLRTTNANIFKKVKEYFTNNQKDSKSC